jgi:hypothetical protein
MPPPPPPPPAAPSNSVPDKVSNVYAGKAYDGYLQDCVVFMDLDGNGVLDAHEPTDVTSTGSFALVANLTQGTAPGVLFLKPAPKSTISTVRPPPPHTHTQKLRYS